MAEIKITRFDGGVSDDIRDQSGNTFAISKHFDNFSNPLRLTPYRDSEDAYASQDTFQGQNFLMYGGNQYILGRQTAAARASILKNTGIDVPSFSTPTNGEDPTYAISNYNLFVEYKGVFYGLNSNGIWSYNVGTTTFTAAAQALTYTSASQGIVHSQTDVLYFGYTNATASYIASKDGAGAWSTQALTIPATLTITSICEYGNFLAILCTPTNGGVARVFFWDMISTDVNQGFDLGEVTAQIIENVEDSLITVSYTPALSSVTTVKVVLSRYTGTGFKRFKTITIASGNVPVAKQKYNDRLYFAMSSATSVGGTSFDYNGLWSVGRNALGNMNVTYSYRPDNNALPQIIKGFQITRDYFYVSYQDADTGTYGLSKTNDQSSYTATSSYETQKMTGADSSKEKQAGAFSVMYAPMPTAGQVIAKYKKDSETGWTTIFTDTTNGAVSYQAVNIEPRTITITVASPGVVTAEDHGLTAGDAITFTTTGALPTGVTANTTYYVLSTSLTTSTFKFSTTASGSAVNTSGSQSGVHTLYRVNNGLPIFKEIQFKIESTGGTEITGYRFLFDEVNGTKN